ncbi:MAG: helix-turn-helix domain-containing protein [Deltaproteobacteria bacterium]|nr:helix-turn-helix domain-containing protein [Deltaproteobacteria bacterium]
MSDRLMSTGDVAEVLGVSEATVKRWADAGTLSCIRTPGGHRKFRLRDIAMHLASRRGPSHSNEVPPTESERDLDEMVSALLVGDVEKVAGAVAAARLQRTSMAALADTLLFPAMQRVRQATTTGRCEAFHEHIALNTLVEVCARQRPSLRVPGSSRGRAVVAPAPGETSDVLARLASLVAVESGFDAYVLGTGLPPSSLARSAEDLGASWVIMTCEKTDASAEVARYSEQVIGGTERSRARLVCVGEAVPRIEGLPEDALRVRDMREMESLLAPVPLRMAR